MEEKISNATMFVSHGQLVHDLAIVKLCHMDQLPREDEALIRLYSDIASDLNDALNNL